MKPALNWQPNPDCDGKVARLGHLTLSVWPMSDDRSDDWNWSIEVTDKYSAHVVATIADGTDVLDEDDEAGAIASCERAAFALGAAIVAASKGGV